MKKVFLLSFLFVVLPLSSARAYFDVDLGIGSRGEGVVALQNLLAQEGLFFSSSTGYFGPQTKAALIRFQQQQGVVPASGYFGSKTRIAVAILQLKNQLAVLQAKLAELSNLPDAQAIVGLNCFYKDSRTGRLDNLAKGSGVVVSADGYIVTVRHLVDFEYANRVSPDSMNIQSADLPHLSFSYCDVARVPAESVLPDETLIRNYNPALLASEPRLRAELIIIPKDDRMSALEEERYDVALLKIKDYAKPLQFARLLLDRNLVEGEKVLTYGYPGDFASSPKQDFSTLYLLGGVGNVKSVYWGDRFFSDRPVIINTTMDVQGGRSGSPVFADGKVAAIVSAYAEGDSTDSYLVSVKAIQRLLQGILNLE